MADTTSKPEALADAPEVASALEAVKAARESAADELSELGPALRRTLDVPAKVKRNPLGTAGVAGGAAFLLLGGPRRTAKAIEKRFFPKRYNRPPSLLPKDVDETLARLPVDDGEQVRGHLERDFAAYLRREHANDPSGARQSIWRTYDLLLGTVGARAARELVKKLFEVPREPDK